MHLLSSCVSVLSFFSYSVFAAPSPDGTSPTTSSTVPASTVCGDIINEAQNGTITFPAKQAYDCLTSVPFNPAVATRFIEYYNDTLQFQSTLAYLKTPPASYQQPAVDLIQGLEHIQNEIDAGSFANEYEFEASLQRLIYSAHDGHLTLFAGVLSAFSYGCEIGLVSLSLDGIEEPKVYASGDFEGTDDSFQPSAITKINGQDVNDYLTDFASLNSVGELEAHAEWNDLMESPALDILGYGSVWTGGATFYPGENLTFTFENGTILQTQWFALFNWYGDTGPLTTGGDFYNFFVLGYYPASYDDMFSDDGDDDSDDDDDTSASATATAAVASATSTPQFTWNNISSAYPDDPTVIQPDLEVTGSGFLTGYFLGDSVAVLSLPSFDEYDNSIATFSDTIGEFLNSSKSAGMKKIVIDVQQNTGGDILLAYDTFKQFFPDVIPFGGSRMRAHPMANVMGQVDTDLWNSVSDDNEYYYDLAVSEWMASDLIDAATGLNFSSWGEFFGPHTYSGDNFTTVQQYNLSSYIYDIEAYGGDGIEVFGYGDRATSSPAPYAAEDIIILSDGLCSSACSLFMEMMHHESGVRTVAVGGRPFDGPMQAPSGSRGARLYDVVYVLDSNIEFVQAIDPTAGSALPNRTTDMWINYASINLRDQIREGGEVPVQFTYEAADCRIYFTPETIYNFTALWSYAADAIWNNQNLCVNGSTGYATTGNATNIEGPPAGSVPKVQNYNISNSMIGATGSSSLIVNDPVSDKQPSLTSITGTTCYVPLHLKGGYTCQETTVCKGDKKTTVHQWTPTCNPKARSGCVCKPASGHFGYSGYCVLPSVGTFSSCASGSAAKAQGTNAPPPPHY